MSSGKPSAVGTGWSIATRLTVWYAVAAFLLVAVATGSLYQVLANNIDREDDQFLVDSVRIVRGLMRERPSDIDALRQEVEWEGGVRRFARVYICILDDSSHILMETPGSRELMKPNPVTAADIGNDPSTSRDFITPAGAPMRLMAAWAQVGGQASERRLIKVALDRSNELALLRSYRMQLWTVLVLSLLAAIGTGYAIARRGLQPIHAITATAQGVGSSTLDRRIPLPGLPAELWNLGERFNQMMQRLEDAFASLTSLSINIAHELRTPINNLRGEVEVALGKPRAPAEYRDALESILEECVALTNMIDALMFLGRADNPETEIARTSFDVRHELADVTEFHEPAAADASVELRVVSGGTPLLASLDRTLFQRALSNLITNAIRYTPAGGRIELSIAVYSRTLQVEVRDTGVGISAEHLHRVEDRFYRIDPSRSSGSGGLGLGLAIVKSIMRVHRGAMHITSDGRRGTTVTLTFPNAVIGAGVPSPSLEPERSPFVV